MLFTQKGSNNKERLKVFCLLPFYRNTLNNSALQKVAFGDIV